MNNFANGEIADKILDKLPQDFFDKHPVVAWGGVIFIIALPSLCSGAKYLVTEGGINFRYWVDAKYGKPTAVVLEVAEPELLGESTAA